MRIAGPGRRARTALALTTVVVSAGLVVTTAPLADTATSAAVVSATLDEWTLTPAPTTVKAGQVKFVVRNQGDIAHEFVVLRTNKRPSALRLKGGKAVETGLAGEISRVPKGTSKRLTLKLAAGRYVLLCNLLGHYQAGQFAGLRVR